MSEQALELNSANSSSWDTKGVALMELNRLKESESALLRALEIAPDRPNILLHLAQLYSREKGSKDEALTILEQLNSRISVLTEDMASEVSALMYKLRNP